jgi:DNA helicase-2/ATP-dependent DNA helicase PcrA
LVGALHYLRDGETAQAMSRLGTNKRSRILRDQLDKVTTRVRGQFAAACASVHQIVGNAVPNNASAREKTEWRTVVDAVAAVASSCSSVEELEERIAEQSRSLRNPPEHAVVLSTIHSAKGLEWEAVFMVGMEDGVLPHVKSDDIEEERRVAYVGVTRARRLLSLTYAAERYGERAKPSPFLFEVNGREKHFCAWTGPNLEGADDRLPLLGADENRRLTAPSRGSSASQWARSGHQRGAAAGRD